MSKATTDDLGELHGKVARTLSTLVEQAANPEAGVPVAVLGAAIAFLKANNISADPSENQGLKELQDRLAARRKDRKLSMKQLQEAEAEFQAAHGHLQ